MAQRVETRCWTAQEIEQGTSEDSILWSWWSLCRQRTIGGTEEPCGGGCEAFSIEKRQTVWEGPGYGKPGGPVKSMRMRVPSPQHTIVALLEIREGSLCVWSEWQRGGQEAKKETVKARIFNSSNEEGKQSPDCQSLWFYVINNYC